MAAEENAALYRRWFEEVVTERQLELVHELLAPNYKLHFPGVPEPLDSTGHLQLLTGFHSAFPDWREQIDDIIAADDKVVIRVTGTGTHQADFQGIPPTGRSVCASGCGIARIANGRIIEAWAFYDALGMLQQLGALPAAQPA